MGSGPTLTSRRSRYTHAAEAGPLAPAPARPPRCRCEHRGARGSRRGPRGLGRQALAGQRTGCWRTRCCCPRWWSVASWRGWCGYRRSQLWTLGLSTLEGDRNQVGLASVPQVQPRRRTGQAVWKTGRGPQPVLVESTMGPPPIPPAVVAPWAPAEQSEMRAVATPPVPFMMYLTARSLMAGSLALMSWNGLLPNPLDTISCILSSETEE